MSAASLTWTARDAAALTRREFAQLRHAPGELIGVVAFPAVMVLLFGYVFGSAIDVPGGNYREYLMPGLFAMIALTGVLANALLVSKDVAEGVMDRFRSMPISRSAVPMGRLLTDLCTSLVALAIMAGIGLLTGWRPHNGIGPTAAAFGLILPRSGGRATGRGSGSSPQSGTLGAHPAGGHVGTGIDGSPRLGAVTPLEPGDPRTIGRYGLTGRLGSGGMGTVYLGRALAGGAAGRGEGRARRAGRRPRVPGPVRGRGGGGAAGGAVLHGAGAGRGPGRASAVPGD